MRIVARLMGSLGVLLLGTIVAAAALKASDQVLRYSIDKATVELLYLPLSAAETFRVKSFIDTVVYRLGDGLGGLTVLACAAWLGWNPMRVGWVTLVAVCAWMAAAAAARSRYVTNLQESIHQHRVDAERAHAPMLDRDAEGPAALQVGTRRAGQAHATERGIHGLARRVAVQPHLRDGRPVLRAVARKARIDRVDAEREQPVEVRTKGVAAQRVPAEQVPVEGLEDERDHAGAS